MLYKIRYFIFPLLALFLQGCASSTAPANFPITHPTTVQAKDLRIPTQADWVDYGTILNAGIEGKWDYYLWGGFAFSVIKKDDTHFLYYQGSSDYRTEYDETVLWRSIGVATSNDGISFTKYADNPILTWFPNQYGEEGAVSSGVTLGDQGDIILYYGANTQEGPTTVNADVRVASSLDGFNFTDLGVVLEHRDDSVWGSGDELFVVNATHSSGTWVIYYIPNGTSQSGQLGVAFGTQMNTLNQSSIVISNNQPIQAWGTASYVQLNENTYAILLNNVREKRSEVRVTSLHTPYILSEPVAIYQFDDVQQSAFLYDEERDIWFLYYRTFDNTYGVKLASLGNTPLPHPSTP